MQCGGGRLELPELVQGRQNDRGIAAAATEPGRQRRPLAQNNVSPLLDVTAVGQLPRRPQCQVSLIGRQRRIIALHGQAGGSELADNLIPKVEREHDRLEIVVAIRTFAGNPEI